jgi:hypothetical protein
MDSLHLALARLQDSVVEVRRALQRYEDEQQHKSPRSSRPSSPITLTECWQTSHQALDHIAGATREWQDISASYRDYVMSRLQDDERVIYVWLPSPLDQPFTAMLNSNGRDARSRKLRIMTTISGVHCIWYSMPLRGYMIWSSKLKHAERAIQMLLEMTGCKRTVQIACEVSDPEEELTQDESPSPSVHNASFFDLV